MEESSRGRPKLLLTLYDVFNPIFVPCSIVGVKQITYDEKKQKCVPINWQQILYNLTFAVFLCSFSIWCLYGKITIVHQYFVLFVGILDICVHLTELLLALVAILVPVFITRENFPLAFENLVIIDQWLHVDVDDNYSRMHRYVFVEMIAIYAFYLAFAFLDIWVWSTAYRFSISQYYLFQPIAMFLVTIEIIQKLNYLILLHRRFRLLNNLLKYAVYNEAFFVFKCAPNSVPKITRVYSICRLENKYNIITIREIRKAYSLLLACSRLINQSIGLLALCLCITFGLNIFFNSYMAIVVATKSDKIPEANLDFRFIVALLFFWTVYLGILLGSLTNISENIMEQSTDTGVLIQEFLLDEHLSEAMVKELEQFAKQVSQKPLQFTAGRFFVLETKIIYQVISVIVSYIIIVLQLTPNN